ncbi:hypothetical protein CIK05_15650 [Bdellovibrio sp. qaytius]|nr:hypothetical protein CIK05_15650 [Bdellovibrio sp. qaytius]
MWKNLRFWLYRLWVVDCVGCGSLVVHPRGLCLSCEYGILDQYLSSAEQAEELEKSGLRFRYLFRWVPGASDVLSKYVYLLKSPVAEPLWHELARYFVSLKGISRDQKIVFVPIPSRKKRKHSLYFAQALAEQCEGVVLELLSIDDSDELEQKVKNKEQRSKVSFTLNEEITEQMRLDHSLVVVDDVITTGASFEAAYNVLKWMRVCPKNIELWAAFRRETMSIDFE